MLFVTIIKVALKSLIANKLRSFLAMLGIIIGVGSVISMLSIGAGARRDVMQRISSMGTNLLSVRPSQMGFHGVTSGSSQNLTLEDAKAILDDVSTVQRVSPSAGGNAQVKYYNKNTRTTVSGCSANYLLINNAQVESGRFFNEAETDRMARVAVAGYETATNLGLTGKHVGEFIKVKGMSFKLIGILKETGGGGRFSPDDQLFVPYTTSMKILFGLDSLDGINVQTVDGSNQKSAETEITSLLRRRHRITNPENDDFRVFNQADLIQTASDFTNTFTFLLGGIAAISLLVGGIGIMNIMLVTVTERTREIGIRKAIGAKDSDILKQFLIEALIMSGVGGLIGTLAGVGGSVAIANFSSFTTFVMPQSVVLALSFSVAIGVFFGYYPAHRAAMLDPIECLYYE